MRNQAPSEREGGLFGSGWWGNPHHFEHAVGEGTGLVQAGCALRWRLGWHMQRCSQLTARFCAQQRDAVHADLEHIHKAEGGGRPLCAVHAPQVGDVPAALGELQREAQLGQHFAQACHQCRYALRGGLDDPVVHVLPMANERSPCCQRWVVADRIYGHSHDQAEDGLGFQVALDKAAMDGPG